MIAIDTNVLLRYLLDDDIEQSPKAKKILTGTDKILLTDIVIIETVWTLKGKKYKLDKERIIETNYLKNQILFLKTGKLSGVH